MRLLRALLRRRRTDRELDRELRFHVDQRIDELVARGIRPDEARRRARLEFGGTQQIKEEVREASPFAWLEIVGNDLLYALRGLKRSPGFAAAAMFALALGSGGTTALATILNDLIVRPPRLFRDARELVVAGETSPDDPSFIHDVAPIVYQQWQSAKTLQRIAAVRDTLFIVKLDGNLEAVRGQAMSSDLLQILGISPILGRSFAAADDRPDAPPIVLVSFSYWQRRFAGGSDILQRRIEIGGRSHAIVGVMPREYALGYGDNLFVPLPRNIGVEPDGLLVVGRRRAAASVDQVRAELAALQRVAEQTMDGRGPGWGVRVDAMRGRTGLGGRGMALVFPVFFAAALLTLVATAANLAILMVARGMTRVKEAAVRAALGASRYRLMQQVLLESLVLAAGGGALGLVVAVALSRFVIAISPGAVPPEFEVPLDFQVFGFAALIVMVAGVASGAAPALAAARTDVVDTLKGVVLPGRRPRRLRGVLVVIEFAITLVLLVAAGLFLDAYARSLNLDPGFDRSHLLTLSIAPGAGGTEGGRAAAGLAARELALRLRALPGVRAVSVATAVPPMRGGRERRFAIEGGDARAVSRIVEGDAGLLGTLGLTTLTGRTFRASDPDATEQVVLSDVLAKRYWGSSDPVGQFIRLDGETRVRQVIGTVSDVRRSFDINRGRIPYAYLVRGDPGEPRPGERRIEVYALLRTSSDAAALAPSVRAAMQELLPDRPMPAPQTLDEMMDRAANDLLFLAFLFTPMVLLTLALSAAGIYGLIAQTVAMRTRELGVRAAMGAERRQLLSLIVGDGLKLARAGVVVGLAGVVIINRIVMSLFVGIPWASPAVVAVCALLMIAVTIAASYRPAARAVRVDPVTALRCE